MLQPPDSQKNSQFASTPTYTPVKTAGAPIEQATIGRSLVIIGRNGNITADVNAREVVIMGKVQGNVICSDRLDIRSDGAVTGDVVTQRISVEDGAILKGSVQVQASAEPKKQPHSAKPVEAPKPHVEEAPKAAAASAGM